MQTGESMLGYTLVKWLSLDLVGCRKGMGRDARGAHWDILWKRMWEVWVPSGVPGSCTEVLIISWERISHRTCRSSIYLWVSGIYFPQSWLLMLHYANMDPGELKSSPHVAWYFTPQSIMFRLPILVLPKHLRFLVLFAFKSLSFQASLYFYITCNDVYSMTSYIILVLSTQYAIDILSQ